MGFQSAFLSHGRMLTSRHWSTTLSMSIKYCQARSRRLWDFRSSTMFWDSRTRFSTIEQME